MGFSAMQIVFAQDETERLHRKKIAPSRIAQNMSPTSSFLDPVATTAGNGRTGSRVHDNSIAVSQGRRQTGIPVAPRNDFRVRPNFRAERFQGAAVIGSAAGEKHPDAIHFLRQLPKNGTEAVRRG
jgi:hypothetical protein